MDWTLPLIFFGLLAFVAIAVVVYFALFRPKRAEEAIEVKGPRRRMDSLVYEEEVDEEIAARKFECPKCSTEIYYNEDECPNCHTRFVKGEYECPSCQKLVDPREKECPYCNEILLEEPFVCPNCGNPVDPAATRCDRCNVSFWSPIRLDRRSLERRKRVTQPASEEPGHETSKAEARSRRADR